METTETTTAIPLSQGRFAIVDMTDHERVSRFKWSLSAQGYAVRCLKKSERRPGVSHMELMHRFIMGAPVALQVDHVNWNKLDNRRCNLRLATRSQNGSNKGPLRTNTSGFKGVYWHNQSGKWMASITVNKKQFFLGLHGSKESAHAAYMAAANFHFGEFAHP